MPADTSATIDSFVIRIIREPRQDPNERSIYRGLIRHVQTDDEIAFTKWAEAVDFIQRFVSIEFPIEAQDV